MLKDIKSSSKHISLINVMDKWQPILEWSACVFWFSTWALTVQLWTIWQSLPSFIWPFKLPILPVLSVINLLHFHPLYNKLVEEKEWGKVMFYFILFYIKKFLELLCCLKVTGINSYIWDTMFVTM
jgi:hypothetical protein